MKRIFLIVSLIFVAPRLFAYIAVHPTFAVLVPGQSVQVFMSEASFQQPPPPFEAMFSATGAIVIDDVQAPTPASRTITVHAIGLGPGQLVAHSPSLHPNGVVAAFEVVECSQDETAVTIRSGQAGPWHYLDASGKPYGGSYEWFQGIVGDTSHPVDSYGDSGLPAFEIEPGTVAEHWVRYTTPCGVATAQSIVRETPRLRIVRH